MLEELYAEVRVCIGLVRDAGFPDGAAAIDTCLYGSTSGEILSHLGFTVNSLLESRSTLPRDLRVRLAALLQRVDAILKDAGRLQR